MKRTKSRHPFLLGMIVFSLFLVASVWVLMQYASTSAAPFSTLIPTFSSEEDEIQKAIMTAMEGEYPQALALLLYDTRIENIKVSSDGEWATAWLVPLDPETGEVVPTEPGLALAHRTADGWIAFVPSDPLWPLIVRQIPDDLLTPEQKDQWSRLAEISEAAVTAPIRGYYLPYAGGDTMALTQSVGHDRYTPSGNAHFSFDFAKPGYPSGMFNVHAAKGGVVRRAVWTNTNGNPNNSNYIVLEDTSTNPTTYQLYMHLAKDSIPPSLRAIGTPVQQGTLIGIADDTGVSSGNHLHFMVHTNAASYWGASIDIQFEDVAINGGRPRIKSDLAYCESSDVCETTQTTYISGNFLSPDHIPPTGKITSPPQGALVNGAVLPLQGLAHDENSGIANAQFLAMYGGEWHTLGNPSSAESVSYSWDMCADGVPDGPVSLALTIRDKAQNQAEGLPGLVHFSKNYECPAPPPDCVPTASQIALFADADFQGACVVLGTGNYQSSTQLGNLGDNNASSIQVGANVQATLFSEINLVGRGETFFSSDSSLTDNPIGKDMVSSVKVQTKTAIPAAPLLVWPTGNSTFAYEESLTFSWENTGGATEFQLELMQGSTQVQITPWSPLTYWSSSGFTSGNYSWRVKARNSNGESNWSAASSFQIGAVQSADIQQAISLTAPYTDTLEQTSGEWNANNWRTSSDANHTLGGSLGWKYAVEGANGYENGNPNSGSLTSPSILIPDTGEYFLRFYYNYETESNWSHWDQRWVQISSDGGPFLNVLQLTADPMGYWLGSPAISLVQYGGQSIRVRFYFVTRDSLENQLAGWSVDDFSITADSLPVCTDNDNSIAQAITIEDGETLNGVICPGGDFDYYKFQGLEGDQIGIRTQAQIDGSPLDTFLTLIDNDGSSPLATNDDIQQFEWTDSFIYYRLFRTGLYYLQVRAWDHPNAGALEKTYRISFFKDNQDPEASFISPQEGSAVATGKLKLEVAARETQSGIALARFYWHSNDWQSSSWVFLGEDWDPSDGWNYLLDTSGISKLDGIAVYSVVFDWAGNWVGTGAWNLHQPMLYLPMIRK